MTFRPALEAIEEWNSPVKTEHGAVEALRLALREASDFDTDKTIISMIRAALGYLEGRHNHG